MKTVQWSTIPVKLKYTQYVKRLCSLSGWVWRSVYALRTGQLQSNCRPHRSPVVQLPFPVLFCVGHINPGGGGVFLTVSLLAVHFVLRQCHHKVITYCHTCTCHQKAAEIVPQTGFWMAVNITKTDCSLSLLLSYVANKHLRLEKKTFNCVTF